MQVFSTDEAVGFKLAAAIYDAKVGTCKFQEDVPADQMIRVTQLLRANPM